MNLKKISLFGLTCVTALFALVACGKKTTTKKTTTEKITTKRTMSSIKFTTMTAFTTKKLTTKKATTTKVTTEKQIPAKYAIDKATFDSYFNPETREAAIAFNATIDKKTVLDDDANTTKEETIKIASNRAYITEKNGSTYYHEYSTNTSNGIIVNEYCNSGSGWAEDSNSPFIFNINWFCGFYTIPRELDYDLLEYDFETNAYEYKSESMRVFQKNYDDREEVLYMSNIKVKFKDGKLVSFSYDMGDFITSGGSYLETNIGTVTCTFSNIGTTVVDKIDMSSMIK